MRNDKMITVKCELSFHFKNVPKFMQKWMSKEFIKYRNEVTKVFNELIELVNDEWDQTGKPTLLVDGDLDDINDVNPEYHELVRTRIQPYIDKINKHIPFCKYELDEYADITGYLPFIKGSRIWMVIENLQKEES